MKPSFKRRLLPVVALFIVVFIGIQFIGEKVDKPCSYRRNSGAKRSEADPGAFVLFVPLQ